MKSIQCFYTYVEYYLSLKTHSIAQPPTLNVLKYYTMAQSTLKMLQCGILSFLCSVLNNGENSKSVLIPLQLLHPGTFQSIDYIYPQIQTSSESLEIFPWNECN